MKILLCVQNLYSTLGGGQTFLKNLIVHHPDIMFYFFGSNGDNMPQNVRAIPISDHHRTFPSGLMLDEVAVPFPELSLKGKNGDIALLLDMAAAASGMKFDVVEIPDFHPLIALLPDLLRLHNVHFKRVVLSLHGALTLSIRQLWQGPNSSDLTVLESYERMAYRTADTRYGISDRYVRTLREREGFDALVVDPLFSINPQDISRGKKYSLSNQILPSLNFIGRQDKIKGPDLFLFIASNIPRNSYSTVNLYGNSVEINGTSSTPTLRKIAERRGITISEDRSLPHEEVIKLYATGRGITFITSRIDTFNLAAFESLLNGCPTVISTACGICDYLEEVWPDLPYVKLNPDNIWGCLPEIMDILSDYDGYRQQIIKALNAKPWPPYGDSIHHIYDSSCIFDGIARESLAQVAYNIIHHLTNKIKPAYLKAKAPEIVSTARHHAAAQSSTDISGLLPGMLYGSDAYLSLLKEGDLSFKSATEFEQVKEKLTEIIESQRVDRVGAYSVLADIERGRGNELLYAVYHLRRFRVSGRTDKKILSEVLEILQNNNFREDAEAARLLYTGTDDDIYEFLKDQPSRCSLPSTDGIEFIEHFNRRENPKVAVLVSIYNAEGKIPQFVHGMRSFIPETIKSLEVIFVDSGSSDASSDALRRELSQPCRSERTLDATVMRTVNRETIQAAWNRALSICRAPYITFLGADEMMRPDSLKILADILDRSPEFGWVQGSAVVCDVNEHGSPIHDIMNYNRQLDHEFMHYLDCCYMGWVGGLYRRSIHNHVGFYNPTFRAAGDNEFKNRALPSIRVYTTPEILGTFRNFPEERTTQSPTAEIEDLRAWHLPRSVGGMRYAFEGKDPEVAVQLFFRCLNYRKSYMDLNCTDLDLALSVAYYIERYAPDKFFEIQHYVPSIQRAVMAYRRFDEIVTFRSTSSIVDIAKISARLKALSQEVAVSESALKVKVPGISLTIYNDNRLHQYQNVWKSSIRRFPVGNRLDYEDLSGPQDLAELLSACQSDDPMVDFDTAWETNKLDQVHRLFEEHTIDMVLPIPAGDLGKKTSEVVLESLRGCLSKKDGMSIVIAGAIPRNPEWASSRVYVLGRAKTLRPVLAGARLPILPLWDPVAIEAMLPIAIELLCSGKPILISRSLANRLQALVGDLSEAEKVNALLICESPEEIAEKVRAFVRAPAHQRAEAGRMALEFSVKMRDFGFIISADADKEFALPSGNSWLLEWDDDFQCINRAIHAYIERSNLLENMKIQMELKLSNQTARLKALSCVRALLVTKTAHSLKTRQRFFNDLSRYPSVPSPEAGLSTLYVHGLDFNRTTTPSTARKSKEELSTDILIPACKDAWFVKSLEWFLTYVLPRLQNYRLRVIVMGVLTQPGVKFPNVQFVSSSGNHAQLQAAKVIVCLGNEDANMRLGSLQMVWESLLSGKPVTGTRSALWMLKGAKPSSVGFDEPEALANDILDLIKDQEAQKCRSLTVNNSLSVIYRKLVPAEQHHSIE